MKTIIAVLFIIMSINVQAGAFADAEQQDIQYRQEQIRMQNNERIAEQRKQEAIANQQRVADQRLQEKAIKVRAENARIHEQNARVAQEAADTRAKVANEERLADKYRIQQQEDEQREYIKQKTTQELRQSEAETLHKEALESAKVKVIDNEVQLMLKKSDADIDVIQSESDSTRNISVGVQNNLDAVGNADFYKFLFIISLIILVLIVVFGVWFVYTINKKKLEL